MPHFHLHCSLHCKYRFFTSSGALSVQVRNLSSCVFTSSSPAFLATMPLATHQSAMATHPALPEIVDQPAIPADLTKIASIVNACPDSHRRYGLPLRSWMHTTVPGLLDGRIRALRKTHAMNEHIGDLRLFSHRMWAWICYTGPATQPGQGKYESTYYAKHKLPVRGLRLHVCLLTQDRPSILKTHCHRTARM